MIEVDILRVCEIENAAHVSPWTPGIFKDCLRVNYLCRLMEVNQDLLGYGILNIAAGEAHLFNICINPDFQRKGYGRKLLYHLLDLARDQKANSIFLEVRPSNRAAVELYLDTGFVEVSVRKDYYPASEGRREDAIIYARDL